MRRNYAHALHYRRSVLIRVHSRFLFFRAVRTIALVSDGENRTPSAIGVDWSTFLFVFICIFYLYLFVLLYR